jgi:hypothetical protein
MIDLLYNLSLKAGLPLFLVITILFSFAVYLIVHYLIKNDIKKNHERVGRILFRVAASLLALILSITFANQRVSYFKLKTAIEAEASKLVDIHIDLGLIDTEKTKLLQVKVRDYVMTISEDGWLTLYEDPFKSRQFVQFLEIYEEINRLEVKNEFEKEMKQNLKSDIDEVSDFLQARVYSTRAESNHLIYTSFFGLTVIMILFAVYPPDKITVVFLASYISFIGIVLYFILMMSNPLKGPLQIEPGPFLMLKETIESNS